MNDLQDALAAGLLAAARESGGWFLVHLSGGETVLSRPAGLRFGRDGRCRLLLRCPDGRLRGVSLSRLEGYDPSPEALLSSPAE